MEGKEKIKGEGTEGKENKMEMKRKEEGRKGKRTQGWEEEETGKRDIGKKEEKGRD